MASHAKYKDVTYLSVIVFDAEFDGDISDLRYR